MEIGSEQENVKKVGFREISICSTIVIF